MQPRTSIAWVTAALAAYALSLAAHSAQAADPLKVGLVLPMSGPFASYGKQIEHGARLYLQQSGGTIAGRPVELIVKDDTGVAPEISKRAAQELVVKDKVDVLGGFGLTPSAFAAAPIATEAKKPMIVMNAAASAITTKSNYVLRVSHTLPQLTAPIADWAVKNGIRKVYTLVADFGPGHDAEAQFKKTFTAGGGEVVGEVRTPVKNPDFAPFLQKIKDIKPDAVFLFVPPGEQTVAFMKGFVERDLAKAGIRIVATGDLTEEDILDAVGDNALGLITSLQYSEVHNSPENAAYTRAYYAAYPKDRPNYMSVSGFDGMQLIARTLEKTGGDVTADKFMAAARGMSWTSPRGSIAIDPDTRDIVQTIYIRKVERVDGKLQNVEFDAVANVRDPGKP
ncbi:ABC transporter substrate-binding protein [Azospirillum sp. A1-3]|uniref:ABC transporter substrate-binding protein n=1 Tax=Azospirillum sp. A1-3 TaxID=185874 RepID=UPI0020778E43|nr:ABC transporter substrate-binding protein [Azospirillum sp. A1-3]MCM8735825.1 ABC transporter substrate-binding protein [Azospirillum sp. A1-3]